MYRFVFLIIFFGGKYVYSQSIRGVITYTGKQIKNAVISVNQGERQFYSDSLGYFEITGFKGNLRINIYYPGCLPYIQKLHLKRDTFIYVSLQTDTLIFNEINIESTRPLLNKKPGAFNTEVYDACILTSSSAGSLFEGSQNISGLRPQINCNICNTGDIHINGMEGAYTNVLIDGMPVIGGIASIYGLTGISAGIIEKIEVSRYPGSVLYGIDNIGGTINIITKKPVSEKTKYSVQYYSSLYMDNNVQVAAMKKMKKYSCLNSIDIMYFDKIFDTNNDGFTDVTLQKRISAFHKSVFNIHDSLEAQIISRVLLEDRWGGEIRWNKRFRGTDSIYGESIITDRYESIVKYPVPVGKIKIENNISYNYHHQNSFYGTLFFEAKQHNIYYQSYTTLSSKKSSHLFGLAIRYLHYKDNTAVFSNPSSYNIWLVPAVYTESTFYFSKSVQSVLSARYDYHNIHRHILTPRIALLYSPLSRKISIRCGFTTGFRPVQLFTEDHAALTGARKIVIEGTLLPEKSYTAYYNMQFSFISNDNIQISADMNTWYVYFSNRIVPDYSYSDKIIYYNLSKNDFSVNRGSSVQLQLAYKNHLQSVIGFSLFDNYVMQNEQKRRLILSEPWSSNWIIKYMVSKLTMEYTGSIYGKMYLPLAGEYDPRPDKSPVYSLQNFQISYAFKNADITVGIKNILDFTPDKSIPFLIARAHDPFDKKVIFDNKGNPLSTAENPYALTFDPTYTYASMQKRRIFVNFIIHF